MKIVVLLLTFGAVLNFSNAAFRVPAEMNYEPETHFLHASTVYLHMEGGNVLSGDLTYLRHCPTPFWVTSPQTAVISTVSVYIRVSHGAGLLGFLQPYSYNRGPNIHGDRAFIRVANNEILTAFLEPDNQTLNQYMGPRFYVRMPNHNHILYSATLRYVDGHRPDWL